MVIATLNYQEARDWLDENYGLGWYRKVPEIMFTRYDRMTINEMIRLNVQTIEAYDKVSNLAGIVRGFLDRKGL